MCVSEVSEWWDVQHRWSVMTPAHMRQALWPPAWWRPQRKSGTGQSDVQPGAEITAPSGALGASFTTGRWSQRHSEAPVGRAETTELPKDSDFGWSQGIWLGPQHPGRFSAGSPGPHHGLPQSQGCASPQTSRVSQCRTPGWHPNQRVLN